MLTWNFPETETRDVQPSSARGAAGTKRFVIRAEPPPATEDADAWNRALFMSIGKKVLKVLAYPMAAMAAEAGARWFAHRWESENRPYCVRTFAPADYRTAGREIDPGDWSQLSQGKALLFTHGTFSRASSAFHGIPQDTLTQLHDRYEQRVFAFDHFTLSDDPQQNVDEFRRRVPSEIALNLDIVAHSRCGLVARLLAGEGGAMTGISVDRLVHVAVPNHGTPLANDQHIKDFINRYTSILNLAPPGPA